jgi:sugar O-acyltransferase (sialic acid O-acetyltransferase NeuD family)
LSTAEASEARWKVAGFIDDSSSLWGKTVNDVPVLGGGDWLKSNGGNVAVCVVANPPLKKSLVARLKAIEGVAFPGVFGPRNVISGYVRWGEGCIVSLPFNLITVNIEIGDFVFVNCATRIGHDVKIGNYTTIYSDVDISGGVEIGETSLIGSGATILPDVKIGRGCVVGGGAVVVKDVPDGVTVAGNPAKAIGGRRGK